jgi:hypothetical protein
MSWKRKKGLKVIVRDLNSRIVIEKIRDKPTAAIRANDVPPEEFGFALLADKSVHSNHIII